MKLLKQNRMFEEKCQRELKSATMIQVNWRFVYRDRSKYLSILNENRMFEEKCERSLRVPR